MRNDILSTTAIALLGRTGGFFVPFVIAAVFGSTRETDVFFLVYGSMLCLMLIMGHLFESVMVPHVTKEFARGKSVDRLIGGILTRTTIWIGLLLLAALVSAKPVLNVATQLSPASVDHAVRLYLIMSPMTFLMAWTSILIGALNANKVFYVGALSPFFRSATVILFVIAFHDSWGINSVAWGYLWGEFVRFFFCWHAFKQRNHRLKTTWSVDVATSDFFVSAAYQTLGFGILCIVPMVNHLAASWLDAGDVSILAYAIQMRNVPSLLFTTGLGTVVLSHWASGYSRSSEEFTWPHVERVVCTLFAISALLAGGLILYQDQLSALVLGWGEFPDTKRLLVAQLFALLVAALPFDVTTLLCVRVLIILKLDNEYTALAALKLVLLIALNCILVPAYGLIGIGIATTIANIVHAVVLFNCVARHRHLLSDSEPCLQHDRRRPHLSSEVAQETT